MARPARKGLDYFPMDVGFLRDKKVRLLRAEYGAPSVLFVLYVLCKVYEGDGYFLKWDKDEALIAADELRESPTYISEVLQGCLSRSLFDERVFQMFGVLTSAGIQRRYLRSCEKRDDIEIFHEYWLLDVEDKKDVPACIRAKLTLLEVSGGKNPVNSPGNPVNSPGNPESKVKESKVKQSKGKEMTGAGHSPDVSAVFTAYFEKIGDRMTERMRDELIAFLEVMGPGCCIRAMDEAIEANALNWRYVRGVLKRKQSEGVRCLDDWDSVESRRQEAKPEWSKKKGSGAARLPDPKTIQEDMERMEKYAKKIRGETEGD